MVYILYLRLIYKIDDVLFLFFFNFKKMWCFKILCIEKKKRDFKELDFEN